MPRQKEPDGVILDTTHIREIKERSDIDSHQNIHAKDLGEDWGDGFFVDAEPVLVTRDQRTGAILRTTPLSELPHVEPVREDELKVVDAVPSPGGVLPTSKREELVEILTMRLFRWYQSVGPHPTRYNPVYDGLPEAPPGSPLNLQPLPGTQIYPATPQQVFDWLKTNVIGPRVQLVNKKRGLAGFKQDLSRDAGEFAVRISREPVR